jgi:hypothetical protein
MKKLLVAALALTMTSGIALADDKPSAEEAEKITAAIKAIGCSGGEFEKETESRSMYEVDDAKCADGAQYDIKLDKDFKILSITAD